MSSLKTIENFLWDHGFRTIMDYVSFLFMVWFGTMLIGGLIYGLFDAVFDLGWI